MDQQNQQTIIAYFGAVGALGGLVVPLLSLFVSSLEKRSRFARQHQILDLYHKRIVFLETWVKIKQSVCTTDQFEMVKQAVSSELDHIITTIARASSEEEEKEQKREELRYEPIRKKGLIRQLLLLYMPKSVAARAFHLIFYMIIGFTFLGSLGNIFIIMEEQEPPGYISDSVIGAATFLFIAFLFWLAAVSLERRAEKNP